MKLRALDLLSCPSCRSHYDATAFKTDDDRVSRGILTCRSCETAVPIVNGFPLFDETRPAVGKLDSDWIEALRRDRFGAPEAYRRFVEQKSRRGTTDLYAAFQPFNESTRAIYPFLPLLKRSLRPGDIILDTWCRTGWSGELLAGLFPEQHVISIWEGDSNVLGYKGFNHWLSSDKRAANLDIMFCHPDRPLPLASNSVALVHGLDSLHRYRHDTFIPETLRVCRDSGQLIFPHIHMTNSEPDPWFERGCMQYHGLEWQEWLDRLTRNSDRRGWVLSEPGLFNLRNPRPLSSEPDTSDYNGLVFIGDAALDESPLEPINHPEPTPYSRCVLNPLLDIRMSQGTIALNAENLGGLAIELRDRHPCYDQRLVTESGTRLSADESLFLWYAQQNLTLEEISGLMQRDLDRVFEIANALAGREIIHIAPVSRAMSALQGFYGQARLDEPQPATFTEIWQEASERYDDSPLLYWLHDETEISFEDADYLVAAVRNALIKEGLHTGDTIAIASAHHPEALLLCWGAWLQGISTAMLDDQLEDASINRLLERTGARLLFSDRARPECATKTRLVVLDNPDAEVESENGFSAWVEPHLDVAPPDASIDPEAAGAILFTSGSTGDPKAVVLSQRALCASGAAMVSSYHWDKERLLSLGGLNMMSGLRNPAVATLLSGSTVLLPGRETTRLPLSSWIQAAAANATVITSVPAWLRAIVVEHDRLPPAGDLRQILITGAPLSPDLWKQAEELLGTPISNYYGMTETGGICAASTLDDADARGSLGAPRSALLQVINTQGQLVAPGELGILRVRSNQLMTGYLDNPSATAAILVDGFIHTGDLAFWDDHGNLHLKGRNDDLLKLRTGERLNPTDLESLIAGIPGVTDAAVTISPGDHKLVALVTGPVDGNAIVDVLSQQVPRNQVPDRFIHTEALPRNRNGKLQRNLLLDALNDHQLN